MAKDNNGGRNEPTGRPDPTTGTNNRPIAPGETKGDLRARSAPGTVVVACKIPNGIWLQLTTWEEQHEPVMGGGHRDVKVGRKGGPRYYVRGPRVPFGMNPTFTVIGGYALTHGIPEEFWERWLEENRLQVYVERELIFAHKSLDFTQDKCVDNRNVLTGLEPIDPENMPRGIQTPMHKIEAADEMKGRQSVRL